MRGSAAGRLAPYLHADPSTHIALDDLVRKLVLKVLAELKQGPRRQGHFPRPVLTTHGGQRKISKTLVAD